MPSPDKAYNNLSFLNSPAARTIRILSEYEEPRQRFADQNVQDTIVFFGSARAKPLEVVQEAIADAQRELDRAKGDAEHARLTKVVTQHQRGLLLARYYGETRELARRMTEWDVQRSKGRKYYVATGGGPGIMEAANRGAADVNGGRSVGLGISLPFEKGVNQYVPEELAFEFHYFFTRKYWFLYLAKAMVLCPGGFGTMDEFFESLTLRQTAKIKKPMPTVLFGVEYWDNVLNVDTMVEWGTVSPDDVNLFHRSDTVDDAFDFLVSELEKHEQDEAGQEGE